MMKSNSKSTVAHNCQGKSKSLTAKALQVRYHFYLDIRGRSKNKDQNGHLYILYMYGLELIKLIYM